MDVAKNLFKALNINDNNINGLAYSVNRLIPIRFAKTCTIGNSMIIIIIIIINIYYYNQKQALKRSLRNIAL
jgi:hypothetical protein